ncbi:MAG: undecaprenyldiphospho-muramoylpentapeptide beta-N-acetylglucosaminyltransferase [Myxococcota bacterium]|nr:undecaprenyldiphospho-muramoylpentapeptide beta-N-acetylglucosaminyltransferase [Myxococcota bacterium]
MASWVIAGGGTGGHVTLALALGEEIARRGEQALFIGTDQGFEAKLVPEAGFELVTLPARQVMGRSIVGRLRGIVSILLSALPARRELERVQADCVLSVGGYAAMPAILAAALRRTPLALLEPNAVPGRTNRLAARLASDLFVGLDASKPHFGEAAERAHCVGIPLRRALIERFESVSHARREATSPFRVLVFGGSQGAKQINDAMIAALPDLSPLPVEIFHQTGEADLERVEAAYNEAEVEATVVAFESDMPARYAWADIAICRSGAITVAELALAGLPSILVPYPFAADDHQTANAAALENAGAALRLDSRALDPEMVVDALCNWFEKPERLAAMSDAAASLARPRAAAEVIDLCTERLQAARQ